MKFDTLPQLEIRVVDENGSVVSGAYVALFDSKIEWDNARNPVQVWRRTDQEGKVFFVDLQEMAYYVYARFDGKDNSFGGVNLSEPLRLNQKNKIEIEIR
ncbi:MAG: carboxypeptidase-like regulatory domain-containing protein [Bacteroidales bacterium]